MEGERSLAAAPRGGLAVIRNATGTSAERGDPTVGAAAFGAAAGLPASSAAPHIPQKRKLSAFFSPHFGQITVVFSAVSLVKVYLFRRHLVPMHFFRCHQSFQSSFARLCVLGGCRFCVSAPRHSMRRITPVRNRILRPG